MARPRSQLRQLVVELAREGLLPRAIAQRARCTLVWVYHILSVEKIAYDRNAARARRCPNGHLVYQWPCLTCLLAHGETHLAPPQPPPPKRKQAPAPRAHKKAPPHKRQGRG